MSRKRSNNRIPEERRLHEAMGECKSLLDWSRDSRCIVGYDTLRQRLVRGWRMSRAMTTAVSAVRRYADLPKEDVTPSRTWVNAAMKDRYVPPFMGRL